MTSFAFGLAAVGALVYAVCAIVEALRIGKIRVWIRYGAPLTVTRHNNAAAYWFLLTVSSVAAAICLFFASHFLRSLI
jgi:uncharacterized membrane protein (DUF2068 family)